MARQVRGKSMDPTKVQVFHITQLSPSPTVATTAGNLKLDSVKFGSVKFGSSQSFVTYSFFLF